MLPGLALWVHHFHSQDCQPHDHKVVPLLRACLLTVANEAERWGLVSSKKAWFRCLTLFYQRGKKNLSQNSQNPITDKRKRGCHDWLRPIFTHGAWVNGHLYTSRKVEAIAEEYADTLSRRTCAGQAKLDGTVES